MITYPLLFISIGLIFATIIEFFIAFSLLKKDSSFPANQFLSLGFIVLGINMLLNFVSLFFIFTDTDVINIHKLINILVILFGMLLFATVAYLRFGSEFITKLNYIIIILLSLLFIGGNIFYNGLTVQMFNGRPQTIWTTSYLVIATTPILLLAIGVLYYFSKLYLDINNDEIIKHQLKLSIFAYSLLLITYFISRLPFYLIQFYPDLYISFQFIIVLTSIGVFIFSILIGRVFLQKQISKDMIKHST